MAFDPSQPFEVDDGSGQFTAFDPNQPFEVVKSPGQQAIDAKQDREKKRVFNANMTADPGKENSPEARLQRRIISNLIPGFGLGTFLEQTAGIQNPMDRIVRGVQGEASAAAEGGLGLLTAGASDAIAARSGVPLDALEGQNSVRGQNPYSFSAGEIASSALPAGRIVGAAKSLGSAALRSDLTGGLFGFGFGASERAKTDPNATVGDVVESGVLPGAIGLGVGAALPVGGAALGKTAQSIQSRMIARNFQRPTAPASKWVVSDIAKGAPLEKFKRAVRFSVSSKNKENEISDRVINSTLDAGFLPQKIEELADSIPMTQKRIWNAEQALVAQGKAKGFEVDGLEVIDDVAKWLNDKKTIPEAQKEAILKRVTERLGKKFNLLDTDTAITELNNELNSVYRRLNLKQRRETGSLSTDWKLVAADSLRDKLSGNVDEATGLGKEFIELRRNYGALSEAKQNLLHRLTVVERQNQFNLPETIGLIEGGARIIEGLSAGEGSKIKSGLAASIIPAGVRKINSADVQLKGSFLEAARRRGAGETEQSRLLKLLQGAQNQTSP